MAEEKQHKARNRREDDQYDDADLADASARKAELDADVDAILDDIDDVLEENAEEFVASFVQKGGQ